MTDGLADDLGDTGTRTTPAATPSTSSPADTPSTAPTTSAINHSGIRCLARQPPPQDTAPLAFRVPQAGRPPPSIQKPDPNPWNYSAETTAKTVRLVRERLELFDQRPHVLTHLYLSEEDADRAVRVDEEVCAQSP